ncbi:MAG: signal peptidase II [Planctomycetes bacterium]|nr:signal peptidase II [Planctomycetota bacterium]
MDRVSPKRYILFVVPAVVGLAADLATKAWLFSWPELRAGRVYWLWQDHAGFQLSLNEGALFGLGQGKVWLFAALSVAAAIAIPVWLFWFRAARDAWLTFALGCVTGGVLGNLFDRLGLHGEVWPPSDPRAGETAHAVRDWILVQINNQWTWPNFNIADSLLVTGAALMFLHALIHPNTLSSEVAREKATPRTPAS